MVDRLDQKRAEAAEHRMELHDRIMQETAQITKISEANRRRLGADLKRAEASVEPTLPPPPASKPTGTPKAGEFIKPPPGTAPELKTVLAKIERGTPVGRTLPPTPPPPRARAPLPESGLQHRHRAFHTVMAGRSATVRAAPIIRQKDPGHADPRKRSLPLPQPTLLTTRQVRESSKGWLDKMTDALVKIFRSGTPASTNQPKTALLFSGTTGEPHPSNPSSQTPGTQTAGRTAPQKAASTTLISDASGLDHAVLDAFLKTCHEGVKLAGGLLAGQFNAEAVQRDRTEKSEKNETRIGRFDPKGKGEKDSNLKRVAALAGKSPWA